ncbi:DUF2059 domain-containing protein [Rhodoferax sp. TH121]|uniref:DUF2059 domain-containing protein n=1 Tax=Rhodoferax sp. TH121 TaxID=2022803 RepID=UPI00159565D7|nr:DUF2059 domain-containing protein [Rhodoferax sp. TH121]
MKRIFVASLLTVCSWMAHAAPPTPESIELLLDLVQAEKIMDGIKPQVQGAMKANMDQALKGRRPSAEEQKVLDAYLLTATQIVNETLTMDRIKPLHLQLYGQHLTQEEVDGMITFYQSPVGKSMVTKMPHIMQGVMAALPSLLAPMQDKLRLAGEHMVRELVALQRKAPQANL